MANLLTRYAAELLILCRETALLQFPISSFVAGGKEKKSKIGSNDRLAYLSHSPELCAMARLDSDCFLLVLSRFIVLLCFGVSPMTCFFHCLFIHAHFSCLPFTK